MGWFQLDPESIATRATRPGPQTPPPGLRSDILHGALGFCAVSVAGFVPWAVYGRPISRVLGEAGMYAVCAIVFIALAGLLLHGLILGTGSLGRFYRFFAVAFTAYSAAWITGWMLLRGHPGSIVGLLAGTAIMGWMFCRAFDAPDALPTVILTLFLSNTAGYFIGGWIEGAVMNAPAFTLAGFEVPRRTQARTAMLLWGVFYGLGLGAGLGHAFHRCQQGARTRILAHR